MNPIDIIRLINRKITVTLDFFTLENRIDFATFLYAIYFFHSFLKE